MQANEGRNATADYDYIVGGGYAACVLHWLQSGCNLPIAAPDRNVRALPARRAVVDALFEGAVDLLDGHQRGRPGADQPSCQTRDAHRGGR